MRFVHAFVVLGLGAWPIVGAAAQRIELAPASTAGVDGAQISGYIREIYQDRDGDLWFGTNGDGVCRYGGTSLTWFGPAEGLGGTAIRGIVQDARGAMWFATEGGVSRLESGAFTNYTVADGLTSDTVWSILLDSSGVIWVGTHGGVCRFDGVSFAPFHLPRVEVDNPESRFSPLVVFAMFEDRAGGIWFGTDGEGAHRYDGESFASYSEADGLSGNMVRSICGDRHGRIWIGSDGGGVSRFDGAGFRTFTMQDGLTGDRVYEVFEDSAGNMWFSTLGAGACRWDGASFQAFGVEQGLSINDLPCPCGSGAAFGQCHGPGGGHVQEILQDRDGVMWFGCSGGLFRLEGERFINVTRSGPWPEREPGAAGAADPMASFARMEDGEWRMGTVQTDTWRWGPGKHSMRVHTVGLDGGGDPWRELMVYYWHPGRKQVRMLGWHPDILGIGRGVSEGEIVFEGQAASASIDLHQDGRPGPVVRGPVLRELAVRWVFDGADAYREVLLEESGSGLVQLAEWDHVRSVVPGEAAPPAPGQAPTRSQNLIAFDSLLGDWESRGAEATGPAEHRSTVEWLEYLDVVRVHVMAGGRGLEPVLWLDAYLYHHVGTGSLHCLALSRSGGVYEGGVSVLDDGALELDLAGFEGDRETRYIVRLDPLPGGSMRQRIWSIDGSDREAVLDVTHHRREAMPE